MEINSMVVIDDNLDNRVAFGMAVEEVKGDIDYYPFTFIDEALTIPNALIQSTPDIIFINLDIPYNNGLDCIRMLRAVEQYKNVPLIVYSDSGIDKHKAEYLGVSHCFHKPKNIRLLVKTIAPILRGEILPVCLCEGKMTK